MVQYGLSVVQCVPSMVEHHLCMVQRRLSMVQHGLSMVRYCLNTVQYRLGLVQRRLSMTQCGPQYVSVWALYGTVSPCYASGLVQNGTPILLWYGTASLQHTSVWALYGTVSPHYASGSVQYGTAYPQIGTENGTASPQYVTASAQYGTASLSMPQCGLHMVQSCIIMPRGRCSMIRCGLSMV